MKVFSKFAHPVDIGAALDRDTALTPTTQRGSTNGEEAGNFGL